VGARFPNANRWLALGALWICASGCQDPVTEIVLVVDSDLAVPTEIDGLTINGAGAPIAVDLKTAGVVLPATLGLLPTGDNPPPFTVSAQATHQGQVVASRHATNVRFIHGQRRALLLSLVRACACLAPPCAANTDSLCADLDDPALPVLDPGHLPMVPRTLDGGADAGADGQRDTAPDLHATTDGPAADSAGDHPGAVDAGGPDQSASDLALGRPCDRGDQCASGSCADGVCCTDACACGECNGATPGTCVPADADTDPKGSCAAYTCDGAGRCRTGCSGGFGSCSTSCKAGYFCDGTACVPANIGAGFFCVAGSCECQAGLSCQQPDAGGAGVCR
jgi:hypothetical protein